MASRKPVSQLSPLLRAMRLPFLALTLSSVFLGSCAALAAAGDIAPVGLTLVLLGALCAHLSVNLLNEYHDFRSGLDAITVRTPFSGGSGALVDHPQAQSTVLRAGLATLAITIVIGGYLALARNPLILPIGILGVVLIASYTPWLNRRPLLCLVAPGIAFGPLMVGGTQLALNPAGPVDWWLGVIPFCLANNLLLLNQLPDLEADRSVGRRHLPIAHGTAATAFVFGAFALATAAAIGLGIAAGRLSALGYLALLPPLLQAASIPAILRHAGSNDKLLPALRINVVTALVTPVLTGIALA